MCGITGIFAFNEAGRFHMINLAKATNTLQKRGPDKQGLFSDDFVGLGHRRLAVIDPSENGSQPISDISGRYTLIYNGEIFNFLNLKSQLEDKGFIFQTHTDTEVLLYAYIAYGKNCLDMLNGFFAFAIYDKEEKSLFIARDRMGIKPLFFFLDEDKFIFGSELKSLLAFGIEKKIDRESLLLYLQLNYIPGPSSILRNVQKLLPGHYVFIENKNVQIEQWYQIPYNPYGLNPKQLSYSQQQVELAKLLESSVQRRLIADVPLGAFLSGGIDSSIITALASRHTQNLNTFSIGYKDEPFFDETKYATLVAKKFGTEHTVFSLTNQDFYNHLFDILDYIDEPFADSSAIPVFILSKYTRQTATVALSGDGADEMFSGYHKHAAAYKAIHGGLGASAVKNLLPLWQLLPKSRNSFLGNKTRQLQRFAEGMHLDHKERYWRWATFATQEEVGRLLSDNILDHLDFDLANKRRSEILKHIPDNANLNDWLYTDMHLVLANDMLTKVDLMSMANSLEVRVPFLDYQVVEFAFSLPESSKINDKMRKRILQDAFRNILPEELYNRPKKGFEIPLLKWFRTELRSLIMNDLLSDNFIEEQGIFNPEEIKKLKKQLFSSSPGDIHARIWALIVFQWWYKKYFA
jgi:asparagine synthase (glutamine-hydrolysing)